jgi:PAS domain S-box-containing protein
MPDKAESPDAEDGLTTAPDALAGRRELVQALVVMRTTLEATTDAVLVAYEKAKVIHFNESFIGMWKIPREVLESATFDLLRELMSLDFADPRRFIVRFDEIVASGQESFDLLELKDGRIFDRASKVLIVEGERAGRVWTFRDTTERHKFEITANRLAALVASSDDAIIGKDLNLIVTSWNRGAERIFGYTAEEMIGTSIMRLIPPDRLEEEKEILSRIRRGQRSDHFDTVRLAKDGRRLNLSMTISPIMDASGHVIGASKVARDISERKKAEEALKKAMEEAEVANRERLQLLDSEREARSQAERASRMKDDFLATLSHELRTPLNAVLGWANILRHGNLQGEELKQGLDIIERNARVQAQIIEDLLDMSRIISGKVRLNVEWIDLAAVLYESIETLRSTALAKGVRLETQLDPFAGPISGDPNRLQQVFWNLLSNAIKFTPKDGKVEVLLKHAGTGIDVGIVDTGEGIAPEFIPYVFDRFQQGDASSTRRHGGLGLGLAIVKQLVELHGGSVRAQSVGLGKGTTFTVHLPITAIYSETEKESHVPQTALRENPPLPELSLANIQVLVVDDEPDARDLVKKLLEIAGATVSTASSAAEAMDRILAERLDVLVCDIGMQEEDGYSFIRHVRATERQEEGILPAIALSAYARTEDRTKAIRAGFQIHLAKPVEPAELLAVVSSLAGRTSENPPDSLFR